MTGDSLEHLLPRPHEVVRSGEVVPVRDPSFLALPGDGEGPAVDRLERALSAAGRRVVRGAAPAGGEGTGIVLELESGTTARTGAAEGYRLSIGGAGIRITAGDPVGLFRGTHALAQVIELERGNAGELFLPGVVVEDGPDFPERGVMLDVSRDRVPTMETLEELVELLSGWGVNRLQLYTEHTFAYPEHEEVWRGCSPMTPDEIRRLDGFCAARFVELVPNQQSFGHFHRWLVHGRYRPLAECPEGVEHPFSREAEPFSLCATDPRCLELLAGLYDELLPCFRSRTLNVGMDETFDLGLGRSAEACRARGVGPVYLDFLSRVGERVRARGHRMQFWADIVLNHPELGPELVHELHGDTVAMLWGYEADHPFERQARALAEAGVPFQVCPGTSSWQSLAGRFTNCVENVAAAVGAGRTAGAEGVLVTDWGDRGHLQPQLASLAGWMTAAELSWNADAPAELRSPEAIAERASRLVFRDPSGAAGRALVRLARVSEATGLRVPNASALSLLITKAEDAFPPPELADLAPAGLERALGEIEGALADLAGERMRCSDRDLVRRELEWTAGILRFAAHLGLERLRAGPETGLEDLAAEVRGALAGELSPLAGEHRALWRLRCRPGGLERSAAWLERVLRRLDG